MQYFGLVIIFPDNELKKNHKVSYSFVSLVACFVVRG